MSNNNEYDFFAIGIRRSKDSLMELNKMAQSIEQQFGINAKMQFEAGICSVMPIYSTERFGIDNLKQQAEQIEQNLPGGRTV